ncbi:hypothetical protein LZS85_15535 [Aliivibrio fischeri]|uniref:hypothetical protein n=1 Tax=Aliivibrio fischeri TaxID=668 RepID=UPI001F209A51|nr:hypothetical protein [Aliivibrio fischeri]MCE7567535.1 hypothetical protein [Aliivibrio fischeri]
MSIYIKVGGSTKEVTAVHTKKSGKIKVVETASTKVGAVMKQFWSASVKLLGKIKAGTTTDHWVANLSGTTVPKLGPVSRIEFVAFKGLERSNLINISTGKDFKYARINLFIPTATSTIPDQTLINVTVTVTFKGKDYPLHMSGRTYKSRQEQFIAITEQQSTKKAKEKNIANQLVKDISTAWAAGERDLNIMVKSSLFDGVTAEKGLPDVTADDAKFVEITSNTDKYNLNTSIGVPVEKKIKINVHSGVTIRSDDATIPAFLIGAQFAGKEITLTNNGSILGKEAGKDVGAALKVQGGKVSLINNGSIVGGTGSYTTKKVIKEKYTQREPKIGMRYKPVKDTLATNEKGGTFRTAVFMNGKNITGFKKGKHLKFTHAGWTYVAGKQRRAFTIPFERLYVREYEFYRSKEGTRDKTIVETHDTKAPAIEGIKFVTIVTTGTITGDQVIY